MTVYLTFNDAPSGVYSSQVVDVVNFLNRQQSDPVRLVAFVSLRNFWTSRKKIRSHCSRSIVLPMFPGVKNWKFNRLTLLAVLHFIQPKTVMARGIFATYLADRTRKSGLRFKLVFDARGAYYAEFKEYRLVDDDAFISQVRELEEKGLCCSDAQLAVSNALVKYWNDEYGFIAGQNCRIIPCTLAVSHPIEVITEQNLEALRLNYGIKPEHALLVYSGSSAGWQSLEPLLNWLAELMKRHAHIRLLLLTPMETLENTPLEPLKDRVILKWVAPHEVPLLLSLGDYGLLLRSSSITNRVASPTKFAEYLAAGLQILISPELGDFSEFTVQHQCGSVVTFEEFPDPPPIPNAKRRKSRELAVQYFTKEKYLTDYRSLTN